MATFKTEKNADLQFTFPEDLNWEEFDKQNVTMPVNMKFVDIVIEREHDVLLIEVKDPSNGRSPQPAREKYFKGLVDNSILKQELTPKARDSYTFLHLMNRDTKPFKYVILLGLDAFENQTQRALLSTFRDRLLNSVRCEGPEPWKRMHITDCIVVTVDTWNTYFANWPVIRLSAANNQTENSN